MKNAQLSIGLKFLKRDKFLLIGIFLLIFVLIYWLGLMFPQGGDPSFLEGMEALLENPLYQFLIGPAISISTINGWVALGWLSYSWWVSLPLGIYLGVRIFALDLNQGTADQLIVTPVSRRSILISRSITALMESLVLPVSSTIGIIAVYFVFVEEPLPIEELSIIFLLDYLFITGIIFLTVFLSLIISELRKTILIISGYYFGSFFMLTFSGMNEDFRYLQDFSIFKVRPVVDVFINANFSDVGGHLLFLFLLTLVLFVASVVLVERIEIKSKMT